VVNPYRQPLTHALEITLDYLDRVNDLPVASRSTNLDLQNAIAGPLPETGEDPTAILDQLVQIAEPGLNITGSGRFFGWVIGGVLPTALAADWITSTWDQNAGSAATAPSHNTVEDVAGTWLKDLFGLPASTSFTMCTGSQSGHFIALAAARHGVLAARGWDVESKGLAGAPPIRVLTTELRHISADRAIRYVGIGLDNVSSLPVDAHGSVTAESLESTLAVSDQPTIVILQAGDLSTGAYDRFDELTEIAHNHGAWVHVDGAIGLWAAASPNYRHLTQGMNKADSWVTDGHKWLNVPYDCGYCFIANPEAHSGAMSYAVSYIAHADEYRDTRDWNMEMSRRGRGFATWGALRSLGRQGVADLVDHCCQKAEQLTLGIGDLPGAEVLWAPIINQGLVRFLDPKPGATDADHDCRTDAVISNILASGEALFGGVTWNGKRAMRISVSNWRTSDADITRTLTAIQQAIESA